MNTVLFVERDDEYGNITEIKAFQTSSMDFPDDEGKLESMFEIENNIQILRREMKNGAEYYYVKDGKEINWKLLSKMKVEWMVQRFSLKEEKISVFDTFFHGYSEDPSEFDLLPGEIYE